MHLCGPALTTIGKRKGKIKWASSAAKQQAEQLEKDWSDIKKKHGVELKEKQKRQSLVAAPWITSSSQRETAPKLPSLDTGSIPCIKKESQMYTGTKMLGIGQLHKSNAVPVFSNEEAIDISRMRR